jgi:hypothetical protein
MMRPRKHLLSSSGETRRIMSLNLGVSPLGLCFYNPSSSEPDPFGPSLVLWNLVLFVTKFETNFVESNASKDHSEITD